MSELYVKKSVRLCICFWHLKKLMFKQFDHNSNEHASLAQNPLNFFLRTFLLHKFSHIIFLNIAQKLYRPFKFLMYNSLDRERNAYSTQTLQNITKNGPYRNWHTRLVARNMMTSTYEVLYIVRKEQNNKKLHCGS